MEFQRSVDETEEWLRFHISLAVVANEEKIAKNYTLL